MSNSMTASPATTTPEEVVALALNEQGFLFQHRVLGLVNAAALADEWNAAWTVEAFEMPVSLPNQVETRVDIVLRHKKPGSPWWVAMECKRASPDYKRWVFFAQNKIGRGVSCGRYYHEAAKLLGGWNHSAQPEPPMDHGLEFRTASEDCPVFDFGIEVRLHGKISQKKASATDAIEGALYQVTLGQAGLALKLRAACELFINLIPVVVTTAELMSADFDTDNVSLGRGEIDPKNLKLTPRKWLAVNYRASDVICQYSRFSNRNTQTLAEHLATRHVRTVFVVQADHVLEFLGWLEDYFPSA